MSALCDKDGVDGPFERAMKAAEREDRDARAFDRNAGAIEALVDADLPVQPQCYRLPRAKRAACGGGLGLFAATKLGVTCPACRRVLERGR